MLINSRNSFRICLLFTLIVSLTLLSAHTRADTGVCGGASITLPFTDVPNTNIFFCSIAEAYLSGLTSGTTASTYSPAANVPREQMAAFVSRTMDQSVKRSSKRAALNQYWTTQATGNLALTTVDASPQLVQSDGADVWVANFNSGSVSRVRGSDGKLLETWSVAHTARGVLCAMGKVFVTGRTNPGSLYQIDPTLPAGSVTILPITLGTNPNGIAYDGQRIWTANDGGSVSIVTLPGTVTTVSTGFSEVLGIVYDGANIWVTDGMPGDVGKLRKLDSTGGILLSVDVGNTPQFPAFDGTNIWVPNFNSSNVTVVRATGALSGTVLTTLSGNGISAPVAAAFDGERILVTGFGGNVSLWKASDVTPITTFSAGTSLFGACSDGVNFWITLSSANKLARF